MESKDYKVGFIGFGHMAQAICQKVIASKFLDKSQIFFNQRDKGKALGHEKQFGIDFLSLQEIVSRSDFLILAVRPHDLFPLLKDLTSFSFEKKGVLSIAAGVSLEKIQKILPIKNMGRAMPNILVEVGFGMTGLTFSSSKEGFFESFFQNFFETMGSVLEVEEKFIDLITAISGSGPAYLFCLVKEAMRFCEKEALLPDQARLVIGQLFMGVGKWVLEKEDSMEDLVQKIAVPGGTTEAGLQLFREKKVEEAFFQTLQRAFQKASKLCP